MIEPAWTKSQQDGISASGQSLLVSAAAGSGKTAVLAERCAHLICDAKPACNVDQLLVVTFTENAAAEMKNRIQQALRRRYQKEPTARLARQVALVESANVSTVHGFCRRLLMQYYNLAQLDPNFQIIDPEEAMLRRTELAREVLREKYQDPSGDFHRFVDCYADGDDELLIPRILSASATLASLVDPAGWMRRSLEQIEQGAKQPLKNSAIGQQFLQQIDRALRGLTDRSKNAAQTLQRMKGFDAYIKHLSQLDSILAHWQQTFAKNGLDALAKAMAETEMPRAPSVASSVPHKDRAKSIVDAVKEEMKAGLLGEAGMMSEALWRDGMARTLPHARMFLALVEDFQKAYQAAKSDERVLDFADLERMTLKLLLSPSSGTPGEGRGGGNSAIGNRQSGIVPSPVALACHDRFLHVLVDEYQDINELQDAILTLVSRECRQNCGGYFGNLFCVGDVKQSIFRFRLAEPGRFLDRQKRFAASAQSAGRVITLRENFRSRAPLLDAVNAVFQRLMTASSAEIEYDESHRLCAGAKFPPAIPGQSFPGAPLELHLLEAPPRGGQSDTSEAPPADDESQGQAELERTDYEALLLATRIRQITGHESSQPMLVSARQPDDTAALRPAGFGDIVILLRAMQNKAERFAGILRAHNIPVHNEGGSGFFQAMEIRDMLSLLAVLDNQQQDIPLAAVLRSPLAAIAEADDALARIRLAYRDNDVPFHQAVVRYANEQNDELAARLRDVLQQLQGWRDLATKRPVAELVWTIYNDSGYLAFCAGFSDGPQRTANLVHLHERASQFGSFTRQGLDRFLRFIDNLRNETDVNLPSVNSQADGSVRIMSIHRAKGLEFPIVMLPDLGKRHNLRDTAGPILLDRAAGLGLAVVDLDRRISYASLPQTVVANSIYYQSLAEELRLLYVAMTRAKEHLILVGTMPGDMPQRWEDQWTGHDAVLPEDAFAAGKTFLDWLGPVSIMTPETFTTQLHDRAEIETWTVPHTAAEKLSEFQQTLAQLQPLPVDAVQASDPEAKEVIARFNRCYQYEQFTTTPAVAAVTSLAKHQPLPPPAGTPLTPSPGTPGEGWGEGQSAIGNRQSAMQRKLDLPRFTQAQFTPAATDIGNYTHLVLQHLDFTRSAEEQYQRFVQRKIITAEQLQHVDRAAVQWVVDSPAGQLMARRDARVMPELAFVLANGPGSQGLDRPLIRGRIDVLVHAADKLTIIDYKTDRVSVGPQLDARVADYTEQMKYYRAAILQITGKTVDEVLLVFLTPKVIRKV